MPLWRGEALVASWAHQNPSRIVEESGVPKASIVEEAMGTRPEDRTRPSDLVILDFAEEERHLIIDEVVTTVYRNSVLPKVAAIPCVAAKQVEDT
jgi:hypothetical protein